VLGQRDDNLLGKGKFLYWNRGGVVLVIMGMHTPGKRF